MAKLIKGVNDLATLFPSIAKELDEKKSGFRADEVTAHSGKKGWFKCSKNHLYIASICDRTGKYKTGCPYCAGKLPIKGETDLETLYPEIAAEFDLQANYPVTPDQITAYSNKKYTWVCKRGHKYIMDVCSRTTRNGCPYCAGQLPIKGETDLETLYPEIAAEFDLQANYPVTPDQITAHSGKKYVWNCKQGHKYIAAVNKRTIGRNCPYCAGRLPIKGETDLETLYPEIAAEFDLQANYPVTPDQISPCTNKKFIWTCKQGHKYSACPNNRIRKRGCPYCGGRYPVKGETDLLTLHEDVCLDWDYERNKKGPEEYLPNSKYNAYWKCHKCNSTYRRRIVLQVQAIGCKHCN